MIISVGIITHEYGTSVYTGVTREDVIKEIYEYVKEWWAHEIDKPFPHRSREEVIEKYFNILLEIGKEEYYEIAESELR